MKKRFLMEADEGFFKDIKNIKIPRIKNNLETKVISDREVTRMLRNTDGFKISLEELKTKPRKK